jgi:hypothetical protein
LLADFQRFRLAPISGLNSACSPLPVALVSRLKTLDRLIDVYCKHRLGGYMSPDQVNDYKLWSRAARKGLIVSLAARHAPPTIYTFRSFAEADGLMSYSTSLVDVYRQVGLYVGRVLKGEKPADLPIVQPSKFELVINLKTANALGVKISDNLLSLADEVIE